MSGWQDISDILTPDGIKRLHVGMVMTFQQEGSQHSYKIMRMPKNGRVWVRPINLVSDSDFQKHYGHAIDASNETIQKYGKPYCTDCNEVIGGAGGAGGEASLTEQINQEEKNR